MKLNIKIKKIILPLLIVLIFLGIFSVFNFSLAQDDGDRFGLDQASGVGLPQNDLRVAIINVIRWILGFLGIIAVIIILYGGFLWMTSGGDPGKINKAKKTLISAIIGIIIILSAFTIASFVINSLQDIVGPGDGSDTDPTTPPIGPGTVSQFSYINKFKDDSISWSRSIGWSFSGVASIPASDTLEVGGYAKNQGSTINAMELYTAVSEDTYSFESSFSDVPTDIAIVDGVYALWNTSAYPLQGEYKSKIQVLIPDSFDFESNQLNTIIRPLHCFNGIQDEADGETGVDCGGDPTVLGDNYCGACSGESCSFSGACADDNCANGVCVDESCLCAIDPIINSIEPANGASGNYITIWGRHFGDDVGSVLFMQDDEVVDFANVNLFADCGDTWSNTQIIFEVPNISLGNYDVVVETGDGLLSNSETFEINDIVRPGVCGVDPDTGSYPDSISIVGNNFPDASSGEVIWSFDDGFSSGSVNWIDENHADDVVPEVGYGRTSIRVYNGTEHSNFYNFLITPGELGDPCGLDTDTCGSSNDCQSGLICDPNEGCTCQVPIDACEVGFSRSCITFDFCDGVEVCPVTGDWNDAVCTKIDPTCVDGISAKPATQSLYAWAFVFGGDSGFLAPKVVEDCSRVPSCKTGQSLPSPSPWYEGEGISEGWSSANYPSLHIENELACVNTVVSARFTEKMNSDSVRKGVYVLKCDSRGGDNCTLIANDSANITLEDAGDNKSHFKFNNGDLEPNSWYKIVLTQDITSLANVPMEANLKVLTDRYCNNVSYSGNVINNPAYCFNFKTRDTSAHCDPGCPECTPDPKSMYYLYEQQNFFADLDSEDNVCLMLDPDAYVWDWNSENPTKVSITNNPAGASSQEGTALGENYNIPPYYTKIITALSGTGLADYCRVTTDFTNPVVIEDPSCADNTIQSPTPWINSTDACLNGLISARFSRDMYDASIEEKLNTAENITEGGSGANGNVIVEKCGIGSDFSSGDCRSIKITEADNIKLFSYSNDVTVEELADIAVDSDSGLPEGFVIDVTADDVEDVNTGEYLDADTWYRVVILGGPNGVTGADKNDDGEPDGTLLTENSINSIVKAGWDYNNDGHNDYYWIFKTGSEVCEVNSIDVMPSTNFIELIGNESEYNAFPKAANCNILSRCFVNWNWRSVIELGDEGETGLSLATISNQTNVCGGADDGIVDPVQTATATGNGEVNIRVDAQGKWDYGKLLIGFGDFSLIKYSPKNTIHFDERDIKLGFNVEAQSATITEDNILLYSCGDDTCIWPALSPLTPPSLLGFVSNPQFAKEYNLKANSNYEIGEKYRVVVKGGESGVVSWNENQLAGLNYNSSGQGAGEECEPGIYPWNTWSGVCNNECILDPDINLCNTRFSQCVSGVDPYCDENCHNTGNTNQASCGNGILEPGEDCDDGNISDNDGCSSNCLWEGSNNNWGSLCFNGIVEYGEECDFGSQADNSVNDCSDICLWNTENTGSEPNVPICGNGIVEVGEECDDSNTDDDDGCSSRCLWEGSTGEAECGNGIVETGQADSFSWTFKAVYDPAVEIDISNCSNGIWQVKVNRGDIDQNDIFICESDAIIVSPTGLWNKIINKIKLAFARFFNNSAIAGSADGCGEGYSVIDQNTTNFEEIIEYMADGSRVYTYIKNGYWEEGRSYKINVYEAGFSVGEKPKASSEEEIDGYCVINDVRVDVWPRGEEKYDDNFFCIGDNCGRDSSNLYDNDISSSSNMDAPKPKYDFPYIKSNGTDLKDPDMSGNQHLYMAWARDSYGSLVKAENGFDWSFVGTPKFEFNHSDADETAYQGDRWITLESAKVLGEIDGTNVLKVTAKQKESGEAEVVRNSNVNIKVFLCSNPWPAPDEFPYRDSLNNCTNGNCPNTNFELYYCRDKGDEGEDDDLPSFSTSTVVFQATPSFKKEFLLQRDDDNSDAVGVRVVSNNDHFSPLLWYQNNFDQNRQGNPTSLTVDGYQAIKEGRTLYVNSVNIELSPSTVLYPSIYLISYNEGGDADTINIYNQLSRYMKLNAGLNVEGGLVNLGNCSGGGYQCLIDNDCAIVNAGVCESDKAKLTRDTKRLEDLQYVNWLLDDYYNQKRCENDRFKTCYSDGECSGGASCENFYPNLPSGTYVSGRSFSVWPSWQATLGNVLGSALPTDPLNKFEDCPDTHDPNTCWSETDKSLECPDEANAYAYYTYDKGSTKHTYAFNEYLANIWYPSDWSTVEYITGNPFSFTADTICQTISPTCSGDIAEGGDCSTCPLNCVSGTACHKKDGEYKCLDISIFAAFIDSDSDNSANNLDNCPFVSNSAQEDDDNDGVGNACDNCSGIKNGSSNSTDTCEAGADGVLSIAERLLCDQRDSDNDGFGDACDICPNNFSTINDDSVCALAECGNGIEEEGEFCDDGDTTNDGPCNKFCTGYTYCGDGVIQYPNGIGQNEFCEDGNSTSGDGCSSICRTEPGWECGIDECHTVPPSCGDQIIQSDRGEVCDDGDKTNAGHCNADCSAYTTCGDNFTQVDEDVTGWVGNGTDGLEEVCDDGGTDDYGACNSTCTALTYCGDNIRQNPNGEGVAEECDNISAGCSSLCTVKPNWSCPGNVCHYHVCPDGVRQWSEACDDGNHDSGDGCSNCQVDDNWICVEDAHRLSTCTIDIPDDPTDESYCGDGNPDTPNTAGLDEVCDDGETTNYGTCNANCTAFTYCGDGFVQDDGNNDGIIEQCEPPGTSNCDSNCQLIECGNGIKNEGEDCDCGTGTGFFSPSSACFANPPPPTGWYKTYNTTYNNFESLLTIGAWYQTKSEASFYYCSDACKKSSYLAQYCGDYQWQETYEECEISSLPNVNYGYGGGTSVNDQWECSINDAAAGITGCKDTGGWCGDGELQSDYEDCDDDSSGCVDCKLVCQSNSFVADDISDFIGTWGDIINSPDCSTAGSITADITLSNESASTAVVFVTDRSASMSDDLATLKTTLKTTIGNLFTRVAEEGVDIEIGLVSYAASATNDVDTDCLDGLGDSLCNSSNAQLLKDKVDAYTTSWGTNIQDGIEKATSILNSSSADKKIMIVMSDGEADFALCNTDSGVSLLQDNGCDVVEREDVFDWCFGPIVDIICSGLDDATFAKDSGIDIYGVGFGGGADISTLNSISSNNGDGSCDHDFCYYGDDDINTLYANIINSIIADITPGFNLLIWDQDEAGAVNPDDYTYTYTYFNNTADDHSSSDNMNLSFPYDGTPVTYTDKIITLPDNYCSMTRPTFSKHYQVGFNFNVTYSNIRLNYCPATFSLNNEEIENKNSMVAGVSEEAKSKGFISKIKDFFSRLLNRFF